MMFEELSVAFSNTSVRVVPQRGALISSLEIEGLPLLFLDQHTVANPNSNVRGGVPLLFPFAGALANDFFIPAQTKIPRHGFARNYPWLPKDVQADAISLVFSSCDSTRQIFPFDFDLRYIIRAIRNGTHITLETTNVGSTSMPLSPGWHPYFHCDSHNKKHVAIELDDFPSARITNEAEFDFGVPAPVPSSVRFTIPNVGRVNLSFSLEMRHIQLWSLPGSPFLCIEPFFGPNNAINTDGQHILLAPGTTCALWMSIELDR